MCVKDDTVETQQEPTKSPTESPERSGSKPLLQDNEEIVVDVDAAAKEKLKIQNDMMEEKKTAEAKQQRLAEEKAAADKTAADKTKAENEKKQAQSGVGNRHDWE